MKCPKCGNKTKVFDTRSDGYRRMRDRQCTFCGYIFSTEEKIVDRPKHETLVTYLNRTINESIE